MRAQLLTVATIATAALAGCATNVGAADGTAADAEVSTAATGIIAVEGTAGADGARTEVVARFVRARGGVVDEDALRMVGAAVDLPAVGSCARGGRTGSGAARAALAARSLALLDVGAVSLVAGETTASLAPRQLPDVADVVSGVVYSARADALAARGAYLLRVDGSAEGDVASFAVSALSPGEPADVRVAGESADARTAAVALAPGSPVDVTWDASAVSGEDLVYVDVGGPLVTSPMRCTFADAGHGTVPASAFGALEEGTLAVHRLHREAFHVRGVEPGEVRFDFARAVAFTRR